MTGMDDELGQAVDEAMWPAVQEWWASLPLPDLLARAAEDVPPGPSSAQIVARLRREG